MAGFTTGDGSFYIIVRAKKLNEIPRIDIGFSIAQHSRDMLLLEKFIAYFKCGRVDSDSRGYKSFKVSNLTDIKNIIIPHFDKYTLVTSKQLNYLDFKKAIYLLEEKDSMNLIINIKNSMNTKRTQFN